MAYVPNPDDCKGPADEERLEHDMTNDVWFECSHDPQTDEYVWMIVPPVDPT